MTGDRAIDPPVLGAPPATPAGGPPVPGPPAWRATRLVRARRGAATSIWLVALLVAACMRPLAVPERQLTLRVALPLTAQTREAVVLFIAAGGRVGDGGTLVQPLPAVEAGFGPLLDALGGSEALRFHDLEGLVGQLIPAAERKRPVVDATEEYPDEVGRVGYLIRNFWFVFYAQKESETGPLPASEWRLTRVAVFRDGPSP